MITFERVTKKSKDFKNIKKLYKSAFPKNERAPFRLLTKGANRDGADFWAAYDGGVWVGFVYVVTSGSLSYVFYYAIAEERRGMGTGTRVLKSVIEKYAGNRLFLALEQLNKSADNYNQRLKRYNFYKRCGLEPMNYKIKEATVTYAVMGVGGAVEPWEYAKLMENYLGQRMSRKVNTKMFESPADLILSD